jgi:hypothetical protein
MIRRLRAALGAERTSQAAEAALERGMAHVLVALDNVIDDDAALGRIYAAHRTAWPGSASGGPEPVIGSARSSGQAASRRRLALRSLTGVAAAAAVAALVLVAVAVPGASDNHAGGATVNTAYVVKRVDRALSAAGPGVIAQVTVTTSGGGVGPTTTKEWFYGDQWRSEGDSPPGHTAYDESLGRGSVYTVVNYPARTWARQHLSGSATPALGPPGCGPVLAGLPLFPSGFPAASAGLAPATAAKNLRAAISCGALTVAGRQRVDGIDAIELTSRPGSPFPETVWVSRGTYLPVRVVAGPVAGTQGFRQTADITWLSPTARNLANLTVPIPAGFHQVSPGPNLRRPRARSAQKIEPAP